MHNAYLFIYLVCYSISRLIVIVVFVEMKLNFIHLRDISVLRIANAIWIGLITYDVCGSKVVVVAAKLNTSFEPALVRPAPVRQNRVNKCFKSKIISISNSKIWRHRWNFNCVKISQQKQTRDNDGIDHECEELGTFGDRTRNNGWCSSSKNVSIAFANII